MSSSTQEEERLELAKMLAKAEVVSTRSVIVNDTDTDQLVFFYDIATVLSENGPKADFVNSALLLNQLDPCYTIFAARVAGNVEDADPQLRFSEFGHLVFFDNAIGIPSEKRIKHVDPREIDDELDELATHFPKRLAGKKMVIVHVGFNFPEKLVHGHIYTGPVKDLAEAFTNFHKLLVEGGRNTQAAVRPDEDEVEQPPAAAAAARDLEGDVA